MRPIFYIVEDIPLKSRVVEDADPYIALALPPNCHCEEGVCPTWQSSKVTQMHHTYSPARKYAKSRRETFRRFPGPFPL